MGRTGRLNLASAMPAAVPTTSARLATDSPAGWGGQGGAKTLRGWKHGGAGCSAHGLQAQCRNSERKNPPNHVRRSHPWPSRRPGCWPWQMFGRWGRGWRRQQPAWVGQGKQRRPVSNTRARSQAGDALHKDMHFHDLDSPGIPAERAERASRRRCPRCPPTLAQGGILEQNCAPSPPPGSWLGWRCRRGAGTSAA